MKTLVATVVLLLVGCANSSSSFAIESTLPLDNDCKIAEGAMVVDTGGLLDIGALDLANAPPIRYLLGVRVAGQGGLRSTAITVAGGQQLDDANRDFAVFDTVKLTYTLGKRALKGDTLPIVLPFSRETTVLRGPIDILGPNGIADLSSGVSPATGRDQQQQLVVGIELKGKMQKLGSPISSGVYYYPIQVIRSAPCAGQPVAGICGLPGVGRPLCQ